MKQQVFHSQYDFVKAERKEKITILFYQITLFVTFILGWEFFSNIHMINPFIFSSPSRIFSCFIQMTSNGTLFPHIGVTLFETMISFLLLNIIAFCIATLLWWNTTFSKIVEPYLVVLNSLPKSALAPILIVWLGNNIKTIIIVAISVAIFGSILNLYSGFQGVEPDKIKLIETLKGSRLQCFTYVILPSSIPLFISIMKVNIGLSLVGVIIGEFLAAKQGLGYLILYGSQVFKLDWVLLSIVLLCLIAMGLYFVINQLEKWWSRLF